MSVSAEWIQLGRAKRGRPVYFTRNEVYSMDWSLDDVNLSDMLITVSPFGGPIGMTLIWYDMMLVVFMWFLSTS